MASWRHPIPLVNSCRTGKRRYPSEPIAERELERLSGRFVSKGRPVPVRAYYCVYCRGFHLTSKERRRP